MAGGCPNGNQAFAKRELRTCGDGMRCYVDVAFAIDWGFQKAVEQAFCAAGMVGVRMGNPCLRQHQAVVDEEFQNGRGIGRIDAGGMVAFLNHPDVVVV